LAKNRSDKLCGSNAEAGVAQYEYIKSEKMSVRKMSELQFIRERAEFMERQVELWMEQLKNDPDLEVPPSVMKYFFHRSCDERYVESVTAATTLVPRQRRPFGGRGRSEEAER
jgi:hypothetical protein